MTALPVTRVVLYKHGVGHFERSGTVSDDATLSLTFEQDEVSDVLKSLTVLDHGGGHISSVSYDSTKPLEQLLAEVALSIPDENSLTSLLPQLKGAKLAVDVGDSATLERTEGMILGIDQGERATETGRVRTVMLSVLGEAGEVRSFDLSTVHRLELLDESLRKDLDYYLRTVLSSKKKNARTFTFFAQGRGERTVSMSYTLAAPVWKATYRIILGEEDQPPMIQGWAVVDNTQDEDWENVQLSLVAGLPVSFIHDLYTPRYIRRPVVEVRETTGVVPPEVEAGMDVEGVLMAAAPEMTEEVHYSKRAMGGSMGGGGPARARMARADMESSTPAQVRERTVGDLFEYEIEHPVTIRRNQSALVPIVLRSFQGRPVLLHNRNTRQENPMRSVEFENSTGLTLEGGPVTVLEAGSYVGEAMLETMKPDEKRLVPYAVELSVSVLDNVESHTQEIHRVVLRDQYLTTHRQHENTTTYHFHNKADTGHVLYLDHARQTPLWELADLEPHETTENYWRFRFELPAKQVTKVVVVAHQPTEQTIALASMSPADLGFWISQKYLDEPTRSALKKILELRAKLAEHERQLATLVEERDSIHREQGRIRENLQALGDRSSEKELRERLVRTLNTQEDRLVQIGDSETALVAERDNTQRELSDLLPRLDFEAKL